MNLLANLTDDQMALMGCGAALFVSGAIMYFSYFLGPARKKEQEKQSTLKIKTGQIESEDSQRKAA